MCNDALGRNGDMMVDATVSNPAVAAAYAKREYVAKDGTRYTRGMDGWFADGGTIEGRDGKPERMVMLVRHLDMADLIAREALDGGE